MPVIRVAMAQLNTVVGDLEANSDMIRAAIEASGAQRCDVVVFPELALTGYPPEDLLFKPGFIAATSEALDRIASATTDTVAIVGFVEAVAGTTTNAPGLLVGGDGRLAMSDAETVTHLANAAAICVGGKVVATVRKQLLPNYGVFDEQRWFRPGVASTTVFALRGMTFGVTICEDIWLADGPTRALSEAGATLICNLNASPYCRGRLEERRMMLEARAHECGAALCYVNQVGGQDELVFDGGSMVLDGAGNLVALAPQFATSLTICDLTLAPSEVDGAIEVGMGPTMRATSPASPIAIPLDPLCEVYQALVLGTRDYFAKNGFSDAVIGLSGGIDSAIVATIAVDALGAEHVHGIALPSRYSSASSLFDAEDLASRLGIDLATIEIEPAHHAVASMLEGVLSEEPTGLTDENLQSRLRGLTLMGLSNAKGWIVLTTGNKSELATGYFTLYGDSAGGFGVIKDVGKLLVYELCRHRNEEATQAGAVPPIPDAILEKAPSAELRPDQRDDQSLPPYEILDPIISAYVEDDLTQDEVIALGFERAAVEKIVALIDGAEYKRRQMPPGVRITTKAFGKDRRMPITNRFDRRRAT